MIKRKAIQSLIELNDISWDTISLDTETTSLKWFNQDIELISICDGNTAVVFSKEIFLQAWDDIKDKINIIIGHNIGFDAKALLNIGINIFDKEWVDTMIMAHLINENGNKGLKDLAQEHLGKTVKSYNEVKDNKEEFLEYSLNDAIYTYELAVLFKQQLVNDKLDKLFKLIEMPFIKVLAEMEMNGVLIDIERVNNIKEELTETIRDLEIEMLGILKEPYDIQYTLDGGIYVISSINFNSNDQLADILFNKLGLEPIKETGTGKQSTGRETIQALKDSHPFVEKLFKYKAAQKLLNAFFEPMLGYVDPDGRIRPHFNDIGTVTGRLSCSDPNLQQLPKNNKELDIDTRSCFIAPPGKTLVTIDYSQQELRIMAELSKDEHLIKIINEGGDLHLINANNVFDLGILEEKLYNNHPEYNQVKEAYKKEREGGKTFSFGIAYGMGIHKLSRDFKVSLDKAQVMLDKFFDGFPELRKSIQRIHAQAEKELYVSTYTGRRRRFTYNQWGKLEGKALRQSFNFLIQSLGADIIRNACIKLSKFAKENPQYGIKLIMTVHDEIVLECYEQHAKEVATISEQLLESCAPSFVCPLKAESGIGGNYGTAK
jgi:DNA polymerase-1